LRTWTDKDLEDNGRLTQIFKTVSNGCGRRA
jgi:hypothetical protein